MKRTQSRIPTVAGWRDFRDSPLPCVGVVDQTHGFVPYTGRRPEHHLTNSPVLGFSVVAREENRSGVDTATAQASEVCWRDSNLSQREEEEEEEEDPEHRSDLSVEEASGETSDSTDSESDRYLAPQTYPLRQHRHYHHHYHHPNKNLHRQHYQSLCNHPHYQQQLYRQRSCPQLLRQSSLRVLPVRTADQGFTAYHPRSEGSNSQLLRAGLQSIFSQTSSLPYCTSIRATSSILSPQVSTLDMALPLNNSPPNSPFDQLTFHTSSSSSMFSMSPQDAAAMVRHLQKDEDSHCYFIHLTLRPLFGDDIIPGSSLRKLPRLVNGIPLGAGVLTRDQLNGIKWRMIEGGHSTITFISSPLMREEAEESKNSLKERLVKQAHAVFGDMTIKASVVLSKCIDYDNDLILNDIAVNIGEGLHFRD